MTSAVLRALAVILGIAMGVLFVAWLRREPVLADDHVPAPAAGASALPAVAPGSADAPAASEPRSRGDEYGKAADAAAVLYGTVKRADGTPVTDGYCWLQRDGKQIGSANLRSGAFAFAGLRAGVHRLTSRIPDELALDREVAVVAPQTRLDLELPPKWLLTVNVVTAEGKPLHEALPGSPFGLRTLRALAFAEALTADLVTSGRSELEAGLGPFRSNDPIRARMEGTRLPKEVLGILTLPPDRPVHVALLLGGTLIAQQAATPGQEKVDFVLAPEAILGKTSTVSLRLLDPDGVPVAGAQVQLSGGGLSVGDKTDAEGRYTAKNVLPGRFGCSAWNKELRTPPLQAEVAPGASLDLGDLVMRKGVEFEVSFAGAGTKVGPGGSGAALVYLYWLDVPREQHLRTTDQFLSEQNGPTGKASLYPGRYHLFARGKDVAALVELDTAALPPQPFRIPWTAAATLRIDSQAVTTNVQYEIATASGRLVSAGETGNRKTFSVSLPPGDYVATIRGSGSSVTRKNIALPKGGAVLTLP